MISEGKKKHDDDVRAIGRAELLAMVRLACVEGRTLAQTKKEAQSAEDEDADADAAESEDLLLAAVCSSTLSNRREVYPLYQSGYSVFPLPQRNIHMATKVNLDKQQNERGPSRIRPPTPLAPSPRRSTRHFSARDCLGQPMV